MAYNIKKNETFSSESENVCFRSVYFVFKEGSFRVVTLLKIHFGESVCRCISIQQSITRSGRMLSDEFLIDLDYVQPVQKGIRLDFPVVASCLRPVFTPVSATMISMTCYKLQNEHSVGFRKKLTLKKFVSDSTSSKDVKNQFLASKTKNC